jgi:hypothetical protein
MERAHIAQICREVLDQNQNGNHTMPAPHLYPHQWLWDSCFIAIGLRHYSTDRAVAEIRSLLAGQWANGMLPNMIFDSAKKYRADRKVWLSKSSPFSPDNVETSGITQPPLVAEALARTGEKLSKIKRIALYKQLLPSITDYHLWLMTERDPHGEGLTLQIHPWETGLDNSPPWMVQLHEHSKPWWIALIERMRLDGIVSLLRRDTRYLPPGQRITNTEALIIFDMVSRFKRKNYDITRILHRSLFCIEDIGYNSILARNNTILIKLYAEARMKLPEGFEDVVQRQAAALQKCWDEQSGYFYSRDFITHELLTQPTIASLLPLYSGVIKKEQAARIVECLKDRKSFGLSHPVPSVPMNGLHFDEQRYWQGPTWINTNWLIIDGLKRYGFSTEAKELTEKTIALVDMHGPYEYFSALHGQPLGAANFSWTAALTIDLLAD